MKEKFELFETSEDVRVEWKSPFGSFATITPLKPLDEQACVQCLLKVNQLCGGLGENGVAEIEAKKHPNVEVELEEGKAPCASNGIFII